LWECQKNKAKCVASYEKKGARLPRTNNKNGQRDVNSHKVYFSPSAGTFFTHSPKAPGSAAINFWRNNKQFISLLTAFYFEFPPDLVSLSLSLACGCWRSHFIAVARRVLI
jgi:hypothetical protein